MYGFKFWCFCVRCELLLILVMVIMSWLKRVLLVILRLVIFWVLCGVRFEGGCVIKVVLFRSMIISNLKLGMLIVLRN